MFRFGRVAVFSGFREEVTVLGWCISAMPDSEPEDVPVFRNEPEPSPGCPFISDDRYPIEEKSTVTISRDGRNGL